MNTHKAQVANQLAAVLGRDAGTETPNTLAKLDEAMQSVQTQISTAWRHLRQARTTRDKCLRLLFHMWRHLHQFLKIDQKHCRRLRRARLLSFLGDAQEQANMRTIHGVFKVIKKLAPRNLQRPQLRHEDGALMDAQQEGQATVAYLQEVYQDADKPTFPLGATTVGLPFTCQELQQSLAATPSRKAGPRHLACNVLYRHSASYIAPILHEFLQQWWEGGVPYVPQQFKDAWLTMPPKPGRICKRPSDLRPIGLSHPLSKCILSSERQDPPICKRVYEPGSSVGFHAWKGSIRRSISGFPTLRLCPSYVQRPNTKPEP